MGRDGHQDFAFLILGTSDVKDPYRSYTVMTPGGSTRIRAQWPSLLGWLVLAQTFYGREALFGASHVEVSGRCCMLDN